jgi:hypothetical protein
LTPRSQALAFKIKRFPKSLEAYFIDPPCGPLVEGGCDAARIAALHSKPGTTTTVLLIRHAERDDYGLLATRGHAPARALVDVVANTGISPNLERNRDTMKPLADRIGVEITLTPKTSLPVVGAICREILTPHAGKVALWVGNRTGPVKYGQLFIPTLSDIGPTQVDELSFDI